MVTVNDIYTFIRTLAPEYMAEQWDRVGLNCGRGDQEVHHILVALDPFPHVCREAIEKGADLLVTHHALIWEPGFVNDSTVAGRSILDLIEHHIAHINAHTNLDCAPGGVNDLLAAKLGLTDIQVIEPRSTDDTGKPWGLLRQGTAESQPLEQFLSHVKNALGCQGLRYVDCGKPVSRVAVGGGACAGEMLQAVRAGCDTFVTADAKYNQFWDAKHLGLQLIDAGHFHTENPVCAYLAQKLQEAFPTAKVTLSNHLTDCAKFF